MRPWTLPFCGSSLYQCHEQGCNVWQKYPAHLFLFIVDKEWPICLDVCAFACFAGWMDLSTAPIPKERNLSKMRCSTASYLEQKTPIRSHPILTYPPTTTPPTLPSPHPILKCKGIGLTHFTLGSTIRGKRQEGKTRNEKKIVIHSLYFLSVHFPTITHSSLTRNHIKFINAWSI